MAAIFRLLSINAIEFLVRHVVLLHGAADLLRNLGCCRENLQSRIDIGDDTDRPGRERLGVRPSRIFRAFHPFYPFRARCAFRPPFPFHPFYPVPAFFTFYQRWPFRAFCSPAARRRLFGGAAIRAALLPAFRVLLRPVASDPATRIYRTGTRIGRARAGTILLVLLPGLRDLLPLCHGMCRRLATSNP